MSSVRRLQTVGRHLTSADLPDINVSKEVYAYSRMVDEASTHVVSKMMHDAQRPYLPDVVSDWGTVTRGDPPGHLVPESELSTAGLTPETWFCDISADTRVDPPHVRVPCTIATPLRLDYATLRALGEKHGTVKVMKAMQCLNVDSPLGQGVWEGVPLSTVLRQVGAIESCRRIFYWGWHNDDPRQVFRSSVSYTEAFEPVPG